MAEVERPRGPVDIMVVAFDEPAKGAVGAAVTDLVGDGTIRILDLLYVQKSADGEVAVLEAEPGEGGPERFPGVLPGLIGEEDARAVAESLENDSAAAVLAWENTWAVRAVEAIADSGGVVVAHERIPAADVGAVLDAFEAMD